MQRILQVENFQNVACVCANWKEFTQELEEWGVYSAAKIDFDDEFIYRELALDINKRTIPVTQVLRDDAHKAFILWKNKCDKIPY